MDRGGGRERKRDEWKQAKTASNQTQVGIWGKGREREWDRSGDERQETSPTDFLRVGDLSCPRSLTVTRRHARSFV